MYSRKKIYDEFTDLPISREHKRQLRQRARGLCTVGGCHRKVWRYGAWWCKTHLIEYRELQRKRLGNIRRNFGSASYGI
jgi:hypothetical protein